MHDGIKEEDIPGDGFYLSTDITQGFGGAVPVQDG